jgi:hypothetical protein
MRAAARHIGLAAMCQSSAVATFFSICTSNQPLWVVFVGYTIMTALLFAALMLMALAIATMIGGSHAGSD